MSKILVIKHGALGDVVLATAPFQAIRKHHKDDHITLLTTKPYADLLKASGYFDEILIDCRPKLYNPFAFFCLIGRIRRAGFTRIYDLQTSERTSWYFRFLGNPKPEWVGTAAGASHRHETPERTCLHTIERHKQQLAVAGITDIPAPDISWLKADINRFHLPERYALVVPGGSSHRPGKRWPASHYATLCSWLVKQGVTPVLIGTNAEASVLSTIDSLCTEAVNLQGKTNFAEVAEIARGARFTIGNDTGPMHLVAVAGPPCLVLFSNSSNPALCAPRGDNVSILHKEQLAELSPETVIEQLRGWL
jgi:ADP-heptose:LPS heptosyltransferase